MVPTTASDGRLASSDACWRAPEHPYHRLVCNRYIRIFYVMYGWLFDGVITASTV